MLAIALGVFVTGCPPQKPEDTTRDVARANAKDDSEPVASIGGEPLTLTEFERRIEDLPAEARSRFASVEARKGFLEAQVQFELLADRAEREGLGEADIVRDEMKQSLADELISEAIRSEVRASDITTEQIRAYYDAHIKDYTKPRRRDVVAIFSDAERDADMLRSTLESIDYANEKQRIYTFRTFADRNAISVESRNQGGAIGELHDPDDDARDANQLYAALAPAVFALEKPGELTPVLPWKNTYVFATYLTESPHSVTELSMVEDDIRQTLFEQARQAARKRFVDDTLAKAKVEVRQDVVDRITKPDVPATPDRKILDALGAALGYDTQDTP
ncbi:MAG: peptidylprolyl isomerase [bacterium]